MMTELQMIEKLESHPVIKQFMEIIAKANENKKYSYIEAHLIGGAVVDILDDRDPKDYDFETTDLSFSNFINDNKDFVFMYETKTAKTYNFNGIIIQLLKVPTTQFEFKISQSKFIIQNGKIGYKKELEANTIHIDRVSFDQQQLIPTSFDDLRVVRDCLMRIPHWHRKGYHIRDETYLSLVRAAFSLKSNKS